MRLNTNVSALRAQRSMSEHSKQIESATGKISSGSRVRSAADDAASLAIGSKLKSNIRSQSQAIRNANDAISQFQVAEGAMNEISGMLGRLRELSVQASNGTYGESERGMINEEYMSVRREIERIARATKFNGVNILRNQSGNSQDFMVGINNDADSKLSIGATDLVVTEFSLGLVDSNIVSAEEARINLGHIDEAITRLSEKRATAGAFHARLNSSIANLETRNVNESDANSRVMDADMAYETSEKIRSEGKLMAATAVMGQANQFSAMALKLLKD
jgi:flagellin